MNPSAHKSPQAINAIRQVLHDLRSELTRADPWPFVSGQSPATLTFRDAGLFLLGCSLQYQMPADQVWRNALRLNQLLDNPENLWQMIASHSETEFVKLFSTHKLHRYKSKAGARVHRIAIAMMRVCQGDSRRLWSERSLSEVRKDLLSIGFGLRISEMILLALIETGHANGCAQIKADIHTRMVLGRLFEGREFDDEEALAAAKILDPEQPHRMDRGLFEIGRSFCAPQLPSCHICPLVSHCVFASTRRNSSDPA